MCRYRCTCVRDLEPASEIPHSAVDRFASITCVYIYIYIYVYIHMFTILYIHIILVFASTASRFTFGCRPLREYRHHGIAQRIAQHREVRHARWRRI